MNNVNIDLEQEPREETASLQVTPGEKESDESVESNYPHFHFESRSPLDIPKTGRMVVEYEIVFSKGEEEAEEVEEGEEGEEGGEPEEESEMPYVYKIDIHRIVGVEGTAPEKTEDALDRLVEAKRREKENVPG